jgi:hypothetical protein
VPESENPRLSKLPVLLIQHELQRIALELHAIDFRLCGLQDALGLDPETLKLTHYLVLLAA